MRSRPERSYRGSILGFAGWLLAGCGGAPASDAAPSGAAAPVVAAGEAAVGARVEPSSVLANVADGPHGARGVKGALLPCPASVPEGLNPPESATLALAVPADGVQVYACTSAKAGEAPAWSLDGPHALLGTRKDILGTHFAGPTWQALDGSSVKGAKVAAADAPAASAIPWLSLSGTPSAEGAFAHVTFIQRLDTVGGKAPATGCDATHVGAKVLVPYQAKYYFYRSAESGEAVHQCRSKGAGAKKS
jgi:uncharacterized protein DUF3455